MAGVTIGVPDPHATTTFVEDILDLHRTSVDGRPATFTLDGEYGLAAPSAVLRLEQAHELELREVRLDLAEGRGPDGLEQRLAEAGVDHEEVDGRVVFHDPDGLRVVCGPRHETDDAPPPSAIRPRRLGHVNMKVTNAARSATFYTEVVGLALSERVGDLLYFFRAGSDHHNIGIRGGADRLNIHHLALEVPGWEYYRIFCDRLDALGHVVEYGPGRHSPGRNLFVYLLEPSSGLRFELFADMAHIDDDQAYEPLVWETTDRSRTMNRWGPGPPQSFLE